MKTTIVRYKVRPDRVDENKSYILKVFEELQDRQPAGLRYASFCLEDGVSFVHVAAVETKDGDNPLPAMSAFKEFVSDIKDRCEEPPVAMAAETLGSYRFFES